MRKRPDNDSQAASALRLLPKVELHCHLDGSLRPATILELARERGVRLPAGTVEGIRPHVQVHGPCSLGECLAVFERIYPLLRDSAALERVAYELCEDSAADNIRHLEVRYAPMLNAAPGFSPEATVEAVLRGLRRGQEAFGVSSGVLLCLFRSHGARENGAVVSVLKHYYRSSNGLRTPSVVGMDLAGDETRFPTRLYAEFFEQARALGIPATCHAGEGPDPASLADALELGVRRIGHGTCLGAEPRLLAEVVRRRVAIEINLTSNLRTRSVAGLREHPARRFFDAGARMSFNTDDRGLFGIDLTHEYERALEAGFETEDVVRVSRDAVDQLFLPDADRAELRRRLDEVTA